jgi:uncharacterized damage-inducible protein DinB
MFRSIDDFLKGWAYESEATLKLMSGLTDASLAWKVYPEGRTLGFLAWHIALSVGEMANAAGLPVEYPGEKATQPAHAADIAAVYQRSADSLREQVAKNWNDAKLLEVLDMYGEKWTRGQTLAILILHQTHHRGQMTVLMRQAGLVVPGVYGPAREEWGKYNLPPQD